MLEEARSFYDLFCSLGEDHFDKPALVASGVPPLNYGLFAELCRETSSALNANPGDRVALVAANGPATAASFLSIASCCGCAPLNPGYREDEFRFYLEDLQPSLVIVEQG